MAAKGVSRAVAFARQTPGELCTCSYRQRLRRTSVPLSFRAFSSSPHTLNQYAAERSEVFPEDDEANSVPRSYGGDTEQPRWKQTPPGMVAPLRTRADYRGHDWVVNTDPKRLDGVYKRLLGPEAENLLSEEVKWLAVTHKSYDHGRRGYNERLSFFGRRIVQLQAALYLASIRPRNRRKLPDAYGRTPSTDPALQGVMNVKKGNMNELLKPESLYTIAQSTGLLSVMQWTPRKPDNLKSSGIVPVMVNGIYAVIGAVALEQGTETAARITRERILRRLDGE